MAVMRDRKATYAVQRRRHHAHCFYYFPYSPSCAWAPFSQSADGTWTSSQYVGLLSRIDLQERFGIIRVLDTGGFTYLQVQSLCNLD
jgi:hypothetical protein